MATWSSLPLMPDILYKSLKVVETLPRTGGGFCFYDSQTKKKGVGRCGLYYLSRCFLR